MFLSQKVLATVDSPINGRIQVIKSLAFGTYITIGGLTQSGGIVYDIWKRTLKKVGKQKKDFKNCLILGLGGGSVSNLVERFWPGVKITGVDIDRIMVDLGKKFLDLNVSDIKIEDAEKFVLKNLKLKKTYDLIIVDLYIGDSFPKKFETEEFLQTIKKILRTDGIVIFNRLYYGEKRNESLEFAKKVQKVFVKVEYFYPEANLMLICN